MSKSIFYILTMFLGTVGGTLFMYGITMLLGAKSMIMAQPDKIILGSILFLWFIVYGFYSYILYNDKEFTKKDVVLAYSGFLLFFIIGMEFPFIFS